MAAQGLTFKFASAILLLQILLATVKAQNTTGVNQPIQSDQPNQPIPPVWNVTTSVEDYIIQNQMQYIANIVEYERKLDEYKINNEGQVDTLAIQSGFIENKLLEVNEKLYPLESLSILTKHCVQSYRWKLPASVTVKSAINSCITSAKSQINGYTSTPAYTKTTLNNYYNNQLKTSLNDCQKKNTASQYNYTVCVTQVINSANIYTINNRKTFSTQLAAAECSANARIITAMECGFNQIYTTSTTIGDTESLIDNCINGLLSYTGGYQNNTSIGIFKDLCPNVLNLLLKEVDFHSATIKNPFYGFSDKIPCLQVNYL